MSATLMSRLLAPAAATMTAGLVTGVASSQRIPDIFNPNLLPFFAFATHPSMPFPPCCPPLNHPPPMLRFSPLGSPPAGKLSSSSGRVSEYVDLAVNTAATEALRGHNSARSATFLPLDHQSSLHSDRGKSFWMPACTLLHQLATPCSHHFGMNTMNSILLTGISTFIMISRSAHPSLSNFLVRSRISCGLKSSSGSPSLPYPAKSLILTLRSFIPHKSLYVWHSPAADYLGLTDDAMPSKDERSSNTSGSKPAMTVVLLGWLGANQKHLKKYADWYLARGMNAVTFIIPMRDLVSFNLGRKAEEQIDHLAEQIVAWLNNLDPESRDKVLLFHTFSNTGWLTYGVILERLLKRDQSLVDKIKGCIVDSAPVAELDPQVWASGFFAALMKKNMVSPPNNKQVELMKGGVGTFKTDIHTHLTETAMLAMLEKFFAVFLQLPYVKQRLAEVVSILSKQQPQCPQLYIYSSADRVIPVKFVETFIDEQRRAGHIVRACNLYSSPHVDHFRSFPEKYSSQLNSFIQECLPQWPAQ